MSDNTAMNSETDQQMISQKANLFLFDLNNEAKERGFKDADSWTLELASVNEVATLRRSHHPIVLMRVQPHLLLDVYLKLKSKLNQAHTAADSALTDAGIISNQKVYLAAYAVKTTLKPMAGMR